MENGTANTRFQQFLTAGRKGQANNTNQRMLQLKICNRRSSHPEGSRLAGQNLRGAQRRLIPKRAKVKKG